MSDQPKFTQSQRSEIGSFFMDVLKAIWNGIFSVVAFMIAGMIGGAILGGVVAVYGGFSLVQGLIIGAVLGFLAVVFIKALLFSDGW